MRLSRLLLALLALAVLLAPMLAPAPVAAEPRGKAFSLMRPFSLHRVRPHRDSAGHILKAPNGKPLFDDPYDWGGIVSCADWMWWQQPANTATIRVQSQTECAPSGTDFNSWLNAGYGGYTGPHQAVPRITEHSWVSRGTFSASAYAISPVYAVSNAAELLSDWTAQSLPGATYFAHTETTMTAPSGDIWDPTQQLTFTDPSADGLTCTLSPDLTIATCDMGTSQQQIVVPSFATPFPTATAQASPTATAQPTPVVALCPASVSLTAIGFTLFVQAAVQAAPATVSGQPTQLGALTRQYTWSTDTQSGQRYPGPGATIVGVGPTYFDQFTLPNPGWAGTQAHVVFSGDAREGAGQQFPAAVCSFFAEASLP